MRALQQELKADYTAVVSRPPSVYRGNPFLIEAGNRLGRGPARRGAVHALPLRQPRSAPVPAVGVRDHQRGHRVEWRNYQVQQLAGPCRSVRDPARPHRVGLGAVHIREQGSDRALSGRSSRRSDWPPGVRAASWTFTSTTAVASHEEGKEALLHPEVHPPYRNRASTDPELSDSRPGKNRGDR